MLSKSHIVKSFAALLLGVLPLAAGCANTQGGMADSKPAIAPNRAVLVSSRTGQSTIIFPAADGTMTVMSEGGDASCEHCKADVQAYFKGASLPKSCSACGATYKAVMAH